MADLVTLGEVKTHLRLEGTTEYDADLLLKMDEATEMVLDWLKNYIGDEDERTARYAVIDAWTMEDVPKPVRSAIFRLIGHLFKIRGDQEPMEINGHDLPPDVTMFLRRLRDPALA